MSSLIATSPSASGAQAPPLVAGGHHHAVRALAREEQHHAVAARRGVRLETVLGQARRVVLDLVRAELHLHALHLGSVVDERDAAAADGYYQAAPNPFEGVAHGLASPFGRLRMSRGTPRVSTVGSGLNASGDIATMSNDVPASPFR